MAWFQVEEYRWNVQKLKDRQSRRGKRRVKKSPKSMFFQRSPELGANLGSFWFWFIFSHEQRIRPLGYRTHKSNLDVCKELKWKIQGANRKNSNCYELGNLNERPNLTKQSVRVVLLSSLTKTILAKSKLIELNLTKPENVRWERRTKLLSYLSFSQRSWDCCQGWLKCVPKVFKAFFVWGSP